MLVFASMIECGGTLERRGEGARHHLDQVSQKARNGDPPYHDRCRVIDQSGASGQGCIAAHTWTYRARPLRRGGRRCGGQDAARNCRLRAAASGNIGCGKNTSVHALWRQLIERCRLDHQLRSIPDRHMPVTEDLRRNSGPFRCVERLGADLIRA